MLSAAGICNIISYIAMITLSFTDHSLLCNVDVASMVLNAQEWAVYTIHINVKPLPAYNARKRRMCPSMIPQVTSRV